MISTSLGAAGIAAISKANQFSASVNNSSVGMYPTPLTTYADYGGFNPFGIDVQHGQHSYFPMNGWGNAPVSGDGVVGGHHHHNNSNGSGYNMGSFDGMQVNPYFQQESGGYGQQQITQGDGQGSVYMQQQQHSLDGQSNGGNGGQHLGMTSTTFDNMIQPQAFEEEGYFQAPFTDIE